MSDGLDAEFLARLAELNAKFAAALPQTLQRMLEAHNELDVRQPPRQAIDRLHAMLHTLAGSSATFGFDALGVRARELEGRLRTLADAPDASAAHWEAWRAALRRFVEWAGHDPKAPYPNDESAI